MIVDFAAQMPRRCVQIRTDDAAADDQQASERLGWKLIAEETLEIQETCFFQARDHGDAARPPTPMMIWSDVSNSLISPSAVRTCRTYGSTKDAVPKKTVNPGISGNLRESACFRQFLSTSDVPGCPSPTTGGSIFSPILPDRSLSRIRSAG